MPEGPEVRTIVEELNNKVAGNKVIDIVFGNETTNLTKPLSNLEFAEKILGCTITKVNRHGKYIDFELDNDLHILTHLLITGRLTLTKDSPYPKFFRIGLRMSNGDTLCLGDARRWTKLEILTTEDLSKDNRISTIGVDVFSVDFTNNFFESKLQTKKAIHTTLLDQKLMSGVGNIYANEALYMSKIHPSVASNKINKTKIRTLYKNLIDIMELAYQERGTTIFSFIEKRPESMGWHTLDGSPGDFWKHVKIFDKADTRCPMCNNMIQKDKVGGRSVYFCPNCQQNDHQKS